MPHCLGHLVNHSVGIHVLFLCRLYRLYRELLRNYIFSHARQGEHGLSRRVGTPVSPLFDGGYIETLTWRHAHSTLVAFPELDSTKILKTAEYFAKQNDKPGTAIQFFELGFRSVSKSQANQAHGGVPKAKVQTKSGEEWICKGQISKAWTGARGIVRVVQARQQALDEIHIQH